MNIRDIIRTVEAHQFDEVSGIQTVLEMVHWDLSQLEQDILEHDVSIGSWNFTIQDQGFLCEGLHAASDFALQGPVVHVMALHYPGPQLKPETWGDEIDLREDPGRLAEWGVERVQAYAVWRRAHPEQAASPIQWLRGLDDAPGD